MQHTIAINCYKRYSILAQIIVDWNNMHLTEDSYRAWRDIVAELFARIDGSGKTRLTSPLTLRYYRHDEQLCIICPAGTEVFFPPKFTSLYHKEGSRETSHVLLFTSGHVITLRSGFQNTPSLSVKETGARSTARTFAGV